MDKATTQPLDIPHASQMRGRATELPDRLRRACKWHGQRYINSVANIAGRYVENQKEKSIDKQKLQITKIEAQARKVQKDGDWEAIAIKSNDNSNKEEL